MQCHEFSTPRRGNFQRESMSFENLKSAPKSNEIFTESLLDSTRDESISADSTEFHPAMRSEDQLVIELDLSQYKIFPCSNRSKHNHKQCPCYHYPKDRRRPNWKYSADMCQYDEQPEKCPKGDSCPKAHSRAELLYNSEKYRTKFCSYYPDRVEACEFGDYCSFAHSKTQIKIDLIENYKRDEDFFMFHYKTVFCPYNLADHDKVLCVYAHNWQDYRRRPDHTDYGAAICSEWKAAKFIKNYDEGGCQFGAKCKKSHGWKEAEFHPTNYKMKKCTLKKCFGGNFCPYYHNENDRRVAVLKLDQFFKFAPRNRIDEKIGDDKQLHETDLGQSRYVESKIEIGKYDKEAFSNNFVEESKNDEGHNMLMAFFNSASEKYQNKEPFQEVPIENRIWTNEEFLNTRNENVVMSPCADISGYFVKEGLASQQSKQIAAVGDFFTFGSAKDVDYLTRLPYEKDDEKLSQSLFFWKM